MGECKICGRRNPVEGANFCYYCGASLRDTDEGIVDARDRYSEEEDADEREREANVGRTDAAPAISRWKILGLMMLLLLPVYGWLFLIGWAVVNVIGSRTPESQKEIAHGILMFFAAAIVLVVLLSVYMNAHPELMEQYNQMYREMMNSGG